jgi:hypothetical protein
MDTEDSVEFTIPAEGSVITPRQTFSYKLRPELWTRGSGWAPVGERQERIAK